MDPFSNISVVIATYNSALFLRETLASIPDGPRRFGEFIFVDGGSRDETLEIIGEFPGNFRVVTQRSRGVYGALNEGVSSATRQWVVFLHSDDLWRDVSFEFSERTASNLDVIWVGDVEIFKGSGISCYKRSLPWFSKSALRDFPFIFHPNALYPTALLRAHPFNQEKFGRKADMFQIAEMATRVSFKRLAGFTYGFRINDGSTTVQGIKTERESWLYWFWRCYVFCFYEDQRLSRIFGRLRGKRIWN